MQSNDKVAVSGRCVSDLWPSRMHDLQIALLPKQHLARTPFRNLQHQGFALQEAYGARALACQGSAQRGREAPRGGRDTLGKLCAAISSSTLPCSWSYMTHTALVDGENFTCMVSCRTGRQGALQHCPLLGKASQAAMCPPACATVVQATAWMLGRTGAGMRTVCV